ncbi:cytochrome P450 [Mycena capillaripes]|nr:cytochrome P450 [Mycena capillaripes]
MASIDAPRTILCATMVVAAALYGLWSRKKSHKLPLPPGPRQLPLVGNLFDVPAAFQWETYARWSKEYNSDIIHLNMMGKSVIVLCSLEATDALLEKHSSMYSDRAELPMVVDLMGWGFNIALMKYGNGWRTHRRLFNQAFNMRASQYYRPQQLAITHALLERLLHNPDAFLDHFRQLAGELIMSAAYGISVLPSNDPYVDLARKAIHAFSVANVPGLYLVDTFPILKHVPRWFPGAGFKRNAEKWKKLARAMVEVPFAETKRQMECATTPVSFTSESLNALKNRDGLYYEEDHVKSTAGTMFIGGADTSASGLGYFVLAMLANPEAQKKAQEEIDRVTCGKYLPTFEDEEALPYVAALLKEVLRWKLVTPFAIPRLLGTDDEYHGYRLPAGSLVIANAWAALHDEAVYPFPHEFKPERFLLDGKLDPAAKDPMSAFGYGRRLCPGRHLATATLWIGIVSMLATFDIRKAVNDQGDIIEPTYEYISGFISGPVPFKCSITPRSTAAVDMIQAARN